MKDFGTFADLHCHTLLKYISNDVPDLWQPIGHGNPLKKIPFLGKLFGVGRQTIADFNSLAKGEVQVVCVALTPPEQRTPFFKGKIPERVLERFSSYLSRIPLKKLDFYATDAYDHYELLLKEKNLYEGGQNLSETVKLPSTGKTKCRYKVAKNGTEVQDILNANNANSSERTIAVVFTIESAHALGIGHLNFNGTPNKFNVSDDILLMRVDAMKGIGSTEAAAWPYPPFWMTMSHAFYNGVCGYPQALEAAFRKILEYSEPFAGNADPQSYPAGLNKGFTPSGKKILERLLGIDAISQGRANKGRRILADIKHMSTQARKEFYEIIDAHNAANPNDIIPVLMSHAAVNGKPLLSENNHNPGDTDEEDENSDHFCPRSINLYDDEIVRIHKTKGMIGLIFYEPIVGGRKRKKGKFFWGMKQWASLHADQIEHILKTVYATGAADKKEAWNCIGLGSDFDGIINPVDGFANSDRYPEFRMEMRSFLNDSRFDPYRSKDEIDTLVDKICLSNVVEFIKRNFK